MEQFIIETDNVDFSYADAFSLRNCCVRIRSGECVFLLGPNGAGKTTLFRLLTGLSKAHAGKVFINGKNITQMKPFEISRMIAFVEQESVYAFPFTVEEVVLMGRYAYKSGFCFEDEKDIQKAEWAMELTDTLQFRYRNIMSLSGGERRRVDIARALAQETRVLLLDEPSSHLDIKQQEELFSLLQEIHTKKGMTLCIISHNVNSAHEYAERILFMKNGCVEEIEDKNVLQDRTTLLKRY